MKWWVRLRLDVPVPPLWREEKRKRPESHPNDIRLDESKRAIIKQDVKHVTAMLLCRHGAEGWCERQGYPLAPLPVL